MKKNYNSKLPISTLKACLFSSKSFLRGLIFLMLFSSTTNIFAFPIDFGFVSTFVKAKIKYEFTSDVSIIRTAPIHLSIEEENISDKNFADMAIIDDADGDGVQDIDDYCPDTPTGVTVNNKGCPDSDGDGVFDDVDLDDDNDGISDIDEGYEVCVQTHTVNVTAGGFSHNLTPGGGNFYPGCDRGNGNTSASNTSIQTENDKTGTYYWRTSFRTLPGVPVRIRVSGNIHNTNHPGFTSSTISVSGGGSMSLSKNGPTSRTATYTINSPGSSVSIYATFNINNNACQWAPEASYSVYAYPQSTPDTRYSCSSRDTDGDGIPNHLDLDSDGDGCSDALEAGIAKDKVTNGVVAGPYGTNGLANSLETNDTDTATTNYYSHYSSIGLNSSINGCDSTDSDSDGVTDVFDIDDDNDGVLDVSEKSLGCAVYTTHNVGAFTYVGDDNVVMNATNNEVTLKNSGWDNAYATQLLDLPIHLEFKNPTTSGTGMIGLTPESVSTVAGGSHVDGATYRFYSATSTMYYYDAGHVRRNAGTLDTTATYSIDIDVDGNVTYSKNNVVISNGVGDYQGKYRLRFSSNVTETYSDIVLTSGSVVGLNNCDNFDIDNDGIYNWLDLDSDGDGCSDAQESSVPRSSLENATSPALDNAIATGPYGVNGLANSLEGGDDSFGANITYNSTFELALSTSLNACADTDGDGVGDLLDIDDDNDGVLDAVESPACFYSEAEAKIITNITSAMAVESASRPYTNAFDGDDSTSSYTGFVPNKSGIGISVYEITPTVPLAVQSIDFSMYNLAFTNGAANKVKLQGFVNGTWEDLSVAANKTVINARETFTNTIHPTKIYKKYRITGASGVVYYARVKEVYLNLNNYKASLNNKLTCTADTDGDGKLNHLDLDSDGDGCSDAVEAGNTLVSDNNIADFSTGADVNQNGLIDKFEEGTSGTINYVSSYSPLAMTSSLNACADTDGDGVGDLLDIDDDNDGVLDAVESPACFYSEAEAKIITNITSAMAVESASRPYTNAFDGDDSTSSYTGFVPNKSGIGISVYEITPTIPLAVQSIDFSMYNLAFTNGAANKVKLQGFVNGTWEDLSIAANKTVINTKETFTNTIHPTKVYKKYRITGASGVVYYARVKEVYLNPNNYKASLNNKPTCTADTDGDGKLNHLDLDTDGDGCSDAVEAGNTLVSDNNSADFSTGADVNQNGLLDKFEDGTSGTINYVSSYSPLAMTSSLNACADTDGDGVGDLLDIDDDNDGVLDAVESPACFYSEAEAKIITNITSAMAVESASRPYTNAFDGDDSTSSYTGFVPNKSGIGISVYEITPTIPLAVQSIDFSMYNLAFTNGAANKVKLQGFVNGTWEDLSIAANKTVINTKETFTNTIHPTKVYKKYRITGASGVVYYARVKEVYLNPNNYKASLNNKPTCTADTDGDGKLNHLDLDTDGDGCSDAVEAGNTLVSDNNSADFSTGADVNQNGLLDKFEDGTSGTINYVSSYSPLATTSSLNACADTDGDGVGDLLDIDDDNDGVLDAVESPACFYSEAEAKVITNITSAMAVESASRPYTNAFDGDDSTSSYTGFVPNKSGIGISVYEITPTVPLAVQSIDFSMYNLAFTNGAANKVKLQGFVNGTWEDLSVAANKTVVNAKETFTNTIHPTKIYKKYRITGASGVVYYARVKEVYLNPNNYKASLNNKPTCTADTDGDGELNHLDLDTDGDGCSDAVEAGNTLVSDNNSTDFSTGADVNQNGLLDKFEDGTSGEINYTSTYGLNALDDQRDACADTDGDGVGDLIDIDDDNDGILDVDEQENCVVSNGPLSNSVVCDTTRDTDSWIVWKSSVGGISKGIITIAGQEVEVTMTGNNYNGLHNVYHAPLWGASAHCPSTTNSDYIPSPLINNTGAYKLTFSKPIYMPRMHIWSMGAGATRPYMDFDKNIVLIKNYSITVDESTDIVRATNHGHGGNGTIQFTDGFVSEIDWVVGVAEGWWTINISTSGFKTTGTGSGTGSCSDIDTDNDGTPNRLDLDSDGDGCSDAVEASNTLVANNNITDYPTGADVNQNGLLDKFEDGTSGEINYTSTYGLNALDDQRDACADTDGDGVGDLIDIDDDNDGILDIDESNCNKITTLSPSDLTWHGTAAGNISSTDGTTLTVSGAAWQNTYSDQIFSLPITVVGKITSVSNGMIGLLGLNQSEITSSWNDGGYKFQFDASNGMYVRNGANSNGWFSPSILNKPFKIEVDIEGNIKYYHNGVVVFTGTIPVQKYKLTISRGAFTVEDFSVVLVDSNCEDIDTDNDGTPNRLDLDSDGDGCSDAVEASNTLVANNNITDYPTGADVNQNGLLDKFEDGTSGEINYIATYKENALDAQRDSCADTDGDGIGDLIDIDDDNDGILDADECPSSARYALSNVDDFNFTAGDLSGTQNATKDISHRWGLPLGSIIVSVKNASTISSGSAVTGGAHANVEYTFSGNMPVYLRVKQGGSIGAGVSEGFIATDNVSYAFVSTLSNTGLKAVKSGNDYSVKNNTSSYINNGTGFIWDSNDEVSKLSVYTTSTNVNSNYTIILRPSNPNSCPDTDNDSIPDYLDLDSDNDGIYDAVEAGHGMAVSPKGDSNAGRLVDTNVGANGFVNALEEGTETGIYISTYNNGEGPVNSDGTGAFDAADTDSDDDGCLDVDEAYNNLSSTSLDTDSNGTYGATGTNTSGYVDENGTVVAASYAAPIDGNNDGKADYTQAGLAISSFAKINSLSPLTEEKSVGESHNITASLTSVNLFSVVLNWIVSTDEGVTWTALTNDDEYAGVHTITLNIKSVTSAMNNAHYKLVIYANNNVCSSITSDDTSVLTVNDCEIDLTNASFGPSAPTTCSPASDGTIKITNAGLNAGASYIVKYKDTSLTDQTITLIANASGALLIPSLVEGSYTDFVISSSTNTTCTASYDATVTIVKFVSDFNVSLSKTGETSYNAEDGTIKIIPSGGTPSYTSSIKLEGSTTELWTAETTPNLKPGKYIILVTDGNGCSFGDDVLIEEVPACTVDVTITPSKEKILCFGDTDITLTATATIPSGSSATTPLVYVWTNGSGDEIGTNASVSGLGAGTYKVVVSSTVGGVSCEGAQETFTIRQPSAVLTASIDSKDVTSVSPGDEGEVWVVASGGTAAYSYLWTNSTGVSIGTTDRITGLSKGTYSVVVTDANGCETVKLSTTIAAPGCFTISNTTGDVALKCNGNRTDLTISLNDASSNYTILWTTTDGDLTGITSNQLTVSGVGVGSYLVTVVDNTLGCTKTATFNVTENLKISGVIDIVQVKCKGGTTGSLDLSITGGTGTYTYVWSSSNVDLTSYTITDQDLIGVPAGSYKVTIKDGNNCEKEVIATITEPSSALSAQVISDNEQSYNAEDGSIKIVPSGGTPSYTSSIKLEGSTTELWTAETTPNLKPGKYIILVTDGNGCSFGDDVIIEEVPACTVDVTITPSKEKILCFGDTDITLTATATIPSGSSATTPLVYVWTNGSGDEIGTNASVSGLGAGTYKVVVSSTVGGVSCEGAQETFTIRQPSAVLTASIDSKDVTSVSPGDEGEVWVVASGGTAAYSYLWTNSTGVSIGTTDRITGLSKGTYSVVVTDANGCETVKLSTTIAAPGCFTISNTTGDVALKCNGNRTDLTISLNDASSNYTILWTTTDGDLTGITSNQLTVSGVGVGSYLVTVVDNTLGCTKTATFNVTENLKISGVIDIVQVKCKGGTTGSLDLSITGGTGTYTYVWSSSNVDLTSYTITDQDLIGVPAGSYKVTIKDGNNCEKEVTAEITEPETSVEISNVETVKESCSNCEDGKIIVTATGGTGSYVYSIDNGVTRQEENIFTALSPGKYKVTVYDANGCFASEEDVEIIEDLAPDYKPVIYANNVIIKENGAVDLAILVIELLGNDSNGTTDVELIINKGASYSLGMDPNLSHLNGKTLDNSNWRLDDSHPSLYRFIYTGNNGIYNGNLASFIGVSLTVTAPNQSGDLPIGVTVRFGSGGEIRTDNNTDSENIKYTK